MLRASGLRACHFNAREVLAGAPADHARDPVQMISEASRLNSDEARAGVLFEARFIVF